MSADVVIAEQAVAGFVLHALWQVPLLAGAAWCAIRLGRPGIRLAHALWLGTLLLSVALPVCSTVAAERAARQDAVTASITYEPATYDGTLPRLQRESAWKRLLHRHANGQPFAFTLPQRAARVLAWSYFAVVVFFALQLLVAWRRMRALVRPSSCEALPVELLIALEQQCARLGLAPPAVQSSADVAGPVLAGVLRPTLLLPARAVAQMDRAEIEAVLLHELAHLRRRDPLLHAACSVLLLPVSFHPAAWWVSHQIRQTREMACDAEAAGRIGSHAAYARSLLRVAERIELCKRRFAGLGFFGDGLFGAGLELFNRRGAMEERMQMLIESRPTETRSRRVVRAAAGVSLGAVAVLAAGMLQVRPALAVDRIVRQAAETTATAQAEGQDARLLSGDHAREQLQQARRDLAKAERAATSDDDRRKISTASGIAAAAENVLAQADRAHRASDIQVDLSGLQVQLSELTANIEASASHLTSPQQTYLQSPEWKANIERQRAYFDSPEWKANIARQQAYFNSPEWKANIEKQRAHFNSPEWRASIEKTVREAKQQAERAREQIRSGVFQRQIDQANQLMARNEPPAPIASSEADGPVKVSPSVMSGNATHKEQPVYPPAAKEKKIQGAVLLHAIINEDGKVEKLSVVDSPDELLSKSAIEAVQKWTYKPYLLNGKPTAVDTTITVHYSFSE